MLDTFNNPARTGSPFIKHKLFQSKCLSGHSCLWDLLFSDNVAVLYRGASDTRHLDIVHHVRESQTQVGAVDGHPCASLWGSSHWGHL